MYTMTYNSLLDDLRSYIERGFTAASDPLVYTQLPKLVTLAERRAARDLKIEGFIRAVTTPLQVGVSVYKKPDRWRGTISMRLVGQVPPLFARSYEYCRNYWPDSAATDTPEFYADYDYNHWLIVPTPIAVQQLEILYHEQPDFLGDANQTNWLTKYAPDVLLYAALLEATPFLKNDERMGIWTTMYQQATGSLSAEDRKRITDRTAVRTES